MKRAAITTAVLLGGAFLASTVGSAPAAEFPANPDMKVYIHIETTPQAAEIVAADAGHPETEVLLGRSPYVAVIACSWPAGLFARKWDRLELWSPAGICRSAYDPATKTYELDASFVVQATGHASRTVDVHVATLTPASVDWENVPESFHRTVSVELEPVQAGSDAPATIRTVVVASKSKGSTENPGSVLVESGASGDRVSIDGAEVGTTPLRMILGPGRYALQVARPGHVTDTRTLTIEPGSDTALRLELQPSPGNP